MPEHKLKVFVQARFEVIWEKLLEKIRHPEKYVEGIESSEMLEEDRDHVLRRVKFVNPGWQELKELIVHEKSSGLIVYRLVDHPRFEGETVNICRTTNQVYLSELEYQLHWNLRHADGRESNEEKQLSEQTLQLALNEMKRIAEEAEATYGRP